MKTVQFIFLLALVSAPACGGNTKVDSLKQLLEQHSTADKAEVLWGIAYELFDVDNTQALFYADRAYHEVWKRGDSLQIVKVGTTYGQLLRRMGKLDRSIEISSRMLPIAKRHEYRKYWKMLLNSLGSAFLEKARYDFALEFYYQSMILREEDRDTMEILTAIQNLGAIHYRIEEHEKSLEYTMRSIGIIKSLDEEPPWAPMYLRISYGNVGSVYLEQGRVLDAIKYFRLALSIRTNEAYPGALMNVVWELASSFLEIGNLDSAKHYANYAIEIGQQEGNSYALANAYIVLSRIASYEQDLVQSKAFLQRAQQISNDSEYGLDRYILRQRLNLLAMGNGGYELVKALRYYEHYCDSLDVINGDSRVKSLQIAFAQRENETKLRAQSAIMQLQRENLDRQEIFVIVVSVLLIVLLVLSMALYRANRRKQAINQMLDRIVEARTRELSRHRDTLQHLIDEENGRRNRTTAELMGLLNSLKGILHLAKVDPEKRDEDYVEKALGLTLQMEGVSQKYADQIRRTPQVMGA